jgi:GT2 family glycosyltransferase
MHARMRPRAQGKFIDVGGSRLWVRGVTYGTFRPGPDGSQFPPPPVVERDFAAIAAAGFNAVRTYMTPPTSLLDEAARHDLHIMAGLWWPGHLTFLDDRRRAREIVARLRKDARRCAGHSSLLGFAIGNEIPAPIVRWHGPRAVTRFLRELYDTAKSEDPSALVTYVSYPTTEYLELPFLDFLCCNVYLESREQLAAYLARLQNLAGDRPLVMGELGLDSTRNGEAAQAASLVWQLRTTFEAGAAGAFVYAWTDEWYAGGQDMDDWGFGLTRRDRTPKPALAAVHGALGELPFTADAPRPFVSVVVCSYNGARTIRETLGGLRRLDYPHYEVIVVDDGSTDATAAIAAEYGVRLISGPNRGLGHARNAGLRAAHGDIVAYIDDDAWPDLHWLAYLAAGFEKTSHAALGGPNIPPLHDGDVAACVANAPGGPIHVLVNDTEAEHIPGCNMAFRRTALEAIGGFDEQFRRAGDDVDVCWRLLERGMTIGFSAAAVVWHHRRTSVEAYMRQQRGYGEAESLLERKWPEKYNALGHVAWAGRLYGRGVAAALARRARIYHGTWGAAPFQSVYRAAATGFGALALTPEWYLLLAVLATISLFGLAWTPLALALPLAAACALMSLIRAVRGGLAATFTGIPSSHHWRLQLLTIWLHLLQPLARLRGRLDGGLTPWRRRGVHRLAWPSTRTWTLWTQQRRELQEWLRTLQEGLRRRGYAVVRGGDWDAWDLHVRVAALGGVRLLMTHEEHGRGRQLVRLRAWPRAVLAAWLIGALAAVAVLAHAAGAGRASLVLVALTAVVGMAGFADCAIATAAVRDLFEQMARSELRRARTAPELDEAVTAAADASRVTADETAA